MSNVRPLFGGEYVCNSPLEEHLLDDHGCWEGFRLGADRWYQLEAHKTVHAEDGTPLHFVTCPTCHRPKDAPAVNDSESVMTPCPNPFHTDMKE